MMMPNSENTPNKSNTRLRPFYWNTKFFTKMKKMKLITAMDSKQTQ